MFKVKKKKKKEISIIMDLTLPEEKLRHKEVTQLASEPAHLTVSYRDPQGQGDRANTGPQGSQPPYMFGKWFTSQALQFRQLGLPCASYLDPPCLSVISWKMEIIVEEHL